MFFIIRSRHQLIFGVGENWTLDFYLTIRSLMSVMLGGLAPSSLYLVALIWTLGQKKWTNLFGMWYFLVDLYDLGFSWCFRNWILLLAVIFTLSHGFSIESVMCKSWELSFYSLHLNRFSPNTHWIRVKGNFVKSLVQCFDNVHFSLLFVLFCSYTSIVHYYV